MTTSPALPLPLLLLLLRLPLLSAFLPPRLPPLPLRTLPLTHSTVVPSTDAVAVFDSLYPEEGEGGYWERNGASRTDGYWEYIKKGEEPPQTLVYGE